MTKMIKQSVVALLVNLVIAPMLWANGCNSPLSVQVLGAGGPELQDGRVSSGYLLWLQGKARVLMDAGSGSSFSFDQAKADFADLDVYTNSDKHLLSSVGDEKHLDKADV